MSKDMMIALGGGILSGLVSLTFVAGFPGAMLVVYMTPLPLFLIGLAFGIKLETVAGVSGTVTAAVFGGVLSGLLFALIYALPVWMAVRLALTRWQVTDSKGVTTEEWTPAGTILGMLALLACALFTLAYLLASGQQGGLQGTIHSVLEKVFTYLMPGMQDSDRGNLLGALLTLFPGYMGMSWVIMNVANGSIALAMLNRIKASVRLPLKVSELALPDRMSWFLIGAAALALVGSLSGLGDVEYIGRNFVLILALPFFFLGLAVVHNLASFVSYPGMLLTVFYMVLLLSGWIAMVVIVAGLIEQWVGIRRHFKAADQGQV